MVAEIAAKDLTERAIMWPALGGKTLRAGGGGVSVQRARRRPPLRARRCWLRLARSRGLITAVVVFLALLLIVDAVNVAPLSYFDVSFLASGGAPLAIAAFGETLVILAGGFDLSAGAVLSLVNVVLAASMNPTNPEASIVCGRWRESGSAWRSGPSTASSSPFWGCSRSW